MYIMYLTINNKKVWPYEWILKSDNSIEWNILPILYDNAKIELYKSQEQRYTLGYKVSTNLLGNEIKYADIIDEITGETFSLQVKNIFLAIIQNNDVKILALVGNEIKLYENFWKSQKFIENDGDKKEMTPLWYYDMFVSYDDNYYYPLILNEKIPTPEIQRFYDYYGYKAYEDDYGNEHILMLIEHEKSSDTEEIWYFIDNFQIISPKVDFWNDTEYVEAWDINEDWVIYMTVTSDRKWYLDTAQKKFIPGLPPKKEKNIFNFTRAFEDTDGNYIVGKNEYGIFIINRNKWEITESDQKSIIYFKDFIKHTRFWKYSFFLFQSNENEIVLVNENSFIVCHTDIHSPSQIKNIQFLQENILEIILHSWEKRQYII